MLALLAEYTAVCLPSPLLCFERKFTAAKVKTSVTRQILLRLCCSRDSKIQNHKQMKAS